MSDVVNIYSNANSNTNSNTKVFKIVVRDNNEIEVIQEPYCGTLALNQLRLDDLEKTTIKFLIQLLHQGKLNDEGCQILGAHLYKVLLDNEIGKAINQALHEHTWQLVRVELELPANLTSWPWEYLYNNKEGFFLAGKTKLVLVRHLRLDFPPPQKVEHLSILRVLFVAANPDDLTPVMYESVLSALQELKGEEGNEKLEVYPLVDKHKNFTDGLYDNVYPNATYQKLLEAVDYHQPHVIHIVAHGRYTASQGSEIALIHDNRQASWINVKTLAGWVANYQSLRLAFLQACESNQNDLPQAYQAISELARWLAFYGLPAVVGVQYQMGVKHQIQTEAANKFTKTFYQELASSRPIDAAVKEGWKQMKFHLGDLTTSHAFGLPVLYCESQALFPPQPDTRKRTKLKSKVKQPACATLDTEGLYRRERSSTSNLKVTNSTRD